MGTDLARNPGDLAQLGSSFLRLRNAAEGKHAEKGSRIGFSLRRDTRGKVGEVRTASSSRLRRNRRCKATCYTEERADHIVSLSLRATTRQSEMRRETYTERLSRKVEYGMTLTRWHIIDILCSDGCRLNSTKSPSLRCRSTIQPYWSETARSLLYLRSIRSPVSRTTYLAPGWLFGPWSTSSWRYWMLYGVTERMKERESNGGQC
jgi:hypothetical protein